MLWFNKLFYKNARTGGNIPSEPDDRDLKYKKTSNIRLSSIDLRPLMPRINNQLNYNSCTAHAACAVLDYNLKYKKSKVSWEYNSSEAYLWYWTRFLEDKQKLNAGVQARNVFKAIRKFGFVPEELWTMSKPYETPPLKVNILGSTNLLFLEQLPSYYSIPTSNVKTIDLVKDALNDFTPVVFAMIVDEAFTKNKGELVTSVSGKTFGHAMVLVGYDERGFIVRNSWGVNWGDKGYGYVDFDCFKKNTYDIWCWK